jgi:diaminopimelate epimerase
MQFTKMHGLENDYIYIDTFQEHVANPAALARVVSDRHSGIGSDGLILVGAADAHAAADLRMRIFNADGGEAAMVFAASPSSPLSVDWPAGIRYAFKPEGEL